MIASARDDSLPSASDTLGAKVRARRSGGLRRSVSLLAAALGLVLAAFVLRDVGVVAVEHTVLRAGGWLPLVVLLHLPQTLTSAAGWGALLQRRERPPLRDLYLFRWVREAINSLLPVAQVGGEVVRVRLLARRDLGLARAGASCVLDITLELVAQLAFTAFGLALLAAAVPRSPVVRIGLPAILALALVIVLLVVGRRLAGAGRLQALLRRWRPAASPAAAIPYRTTPGQQLRATLWHLLSWLLGALETWAGLRAVGVHAGLAEATVVESLGQVVRIVAFAVPGAIGVQEGGLVLICGLFGVAPAAAVGLSLVRRLREVALGAPGLLAWRMAER